MWEHDGHANLEVTVNKPVLPNFQLYHEINMIHERVVDFSSCRKAGHDKLEAFGKLGGVVARRDAVEGGLAIAQVEEGHFYAESPEHCIAIQVDQFAAVSGMMELEGVVVVVPGVSVMPGVVRFTWTTEVLMDVLPCASVAVQVMVVSPTMKLISLRSYQLRRLSIAPGTPEKTSSVFSPAELKPI